MEERAASKGFYEMLWDCPYCDTKGLLAKSQRHCANCGAKQDPDKRYFPTDDQKQRVDGHQFEGSDRTCPACTAPQSAKATHCTHCGASLDGASEVRGVVTPVKPKPKRKLWPILLVIGIVALIIFAIWYFFIRTKEAKLTVTAHRWERVIGIEEFGDRDESAWRNEVPSDARMVTCHREQRGTRQVKDGQTCRIEKVDRKDGTFEEIEKCRDKFRSEPEYDEKCRYTVRRWKEVDAAKTSGTGLSPAWPTQALPPPNASELPGSRREGKRRETYKLDFGKQSCDVSEKVWRKYTDGTAYKVEVRARSGDVVCTSL